MGLTGKLEAELELKATAEKQHNKWRKEAHHFPDAVGHHIQGVAVHEGDWDSHGAIKVWNYTCEGKQEVYKERVEIDDEQNKVTVVGVGGHVMDEFKSYKVTFQYIPKPQGGCIGKVTIEYEKLNEDIRDPTRYFEFVKSLVLDMDAHLVKHSA